MGRRKGVFIFKKKKFFEITVGNTMFLQAAQLQSGSTRPHSPFIDETQLISSGPLSSHGEVTQEPSTNFKKWFLLHLTISIEKLS